MSVYFGNARNRYGKMIMSHMVSDRTVEFFWIADGLQLRGAGFSPGRIRAST